jgi:hypothetical protein
MHSSPTLLAFGRYLTFVALIYKECDLTGFSFNPLDLEAFSALDVRDQKVALTEVCEWYFSH